MAFTWLKKVAGRAKQAARKDRSVSSRWQRARLQLESLEDRCLLATPIHDITSGHSFGNLQAAIDDPTTLPNNIIQIDSGTYTITQDAADNDAGGTIYGYYVNKPLTIQPSPNATVKIVAPATGTLADTKDSSSFGGTSISAFIVAANGVTINNNSANSGSLTIDGDPGSTGHNNFRNGIITDFRIADMPIGANNYSNMTVTGVTVQNILRRGIEVGTNGTGNVISGNVVTNVRGVNTIGTTDVANGIGVFGGDATVNNNTVSFSTIGIAANADVTDNNPQHPLLTVLGNNLFDNQFGMNLAALTNGSVIGNTTGGANTISTAGGGSNTFGFGDGVGIEVSFIGTFGGLGGGAATVTVQGNVISASNNDTAIWLFNNGLLDSGPAPAVLVDDNSLSLNSPGTRASDGWRTGIFVFDNNTLNQDNQAEFNDVSILRNTISGFWRGVDVNSSKGQDEIATIGDSMSGDSNDFVGNNRMTGTIGIRATVASGTAGGAQAFVGLNTFDTGNSYKTGIQSLGTSNSGGDVTFTDPTTVYGSGIGLDIEGADATVNVDAAGVNLNSAAGAIGLKLNGGAIFTSLDPTNTTNNLTSNNNFEMDSGSVEMGLSGPSTAVFNKNSFGTVVLDQGTDTYTGPTFLLLGTLTQNGNWDFGSLDGPAPRITLQGVLTTLNGTGFDDGRNVFITGAVDTVQGLTFDNYAAGTAAITVLDHTNGTYYAQIGGNTAGQPITINGPGGDGTTGILIGDLGSAIIEGVPGNGDSAAIPTVIDGNCYGVDVAGGLAYIQDVNLSSNTSGVDPVTFTGPAGLRIRPDPNNGLDDGVVDAGQVGGGIDYTGLGDGADGSFSVGLGSHGGNTFNGYTQYTTNPNDPIVPSVPQAIVDLDNNDPNNLPGPQGLPYDVQAQNNSFDGHSQTDYAYIETLVYHDTDDSNFGFVNFLHPSGANPSLVGGSPFYYASNPEVGGNATEGGPNGGAANLEKSQIAFIRLEFDNVVNILNPNDANSTNGGIQVIKAPANDDPANPSNASPTPSATGNSTTGSIGVQVIGQGLDTSHPGDYFVDLQVLGNNASGMSALDPNSASLIDGVYKVFVTNGGVTTGNPNTGQIGAPANSSSSYFWRLFGDLSGQGQVTGPASTTMTDLFDIDQAENHGATQYDYMNWTISSPFAGSLAYATTRFNVYGSSYVSGFTSPPGF